MLGLLLAISTASADQCAWITEENAAAALEHLRPGVEWLRFCEPCGEKQPTPGTVERATAAEVSGGRYHEVSIDGRPVDLAYTFVKLNSKDAWYANLAKTVGCPASGVSRKVTWPLSTQQADRLQSWLGTYTGPKRRLVITPFFDDPNGLQIQLEYPTEHEPTASTFELVAYVDIDGDPLSFATPFGSCRVVLSKNTSGVVLTPDSACKGLLDAVAGSYASRG